MGRGGFFFFLIKTKHFLQLNVTNSCCATSQGKQAPKVPNRDKPCCTKLFGTDPLIADPHRLQPLPCPASPPFLGQCLHTVGPDYPSLLLHCPDFLVQHPSQARTCVPLPVTVPIPILAPIPVLVPILIPVLVLVPILVPILMPNPVLVPIPIPILVLTPPLPPSPISILSLSLSMSPSPHLLPYTLMALISAPSPQREGDAQE